MPSKPPYDPYTMSPTQEPEPPRCAAADCGEPAPRFYKGGLCRHDYREDAKGLSFSEAYFRLARLDEEKEEHLEQYASQLEKEAMIIDHSMLSPHLRQIARELRLINAGVSPIDIKHGTWPNLEEFQIED